MTLDGSFAVAADRACVWEKIRDPALMAACIPGCSKIERLSADSYRAVVKVGIGPISASFNLVVEVTEEQPSYRILSVTRGEEGTRASVLNARSELSLADAEAGGTVVRYGSEVSITGRLGKFGLGIMKKKADALSEQFVAAFRQKLEAC